MRSLLLSALILLAASAAQAIQLTTCIRVRIDSVTLYPEDRSQTAPLAPDHPAYTAPGNPTPAVGDLFYGSVTYDNATIPDSGVYRVGNSSLYTGISSFEEYQGWGIEWDGVLAAPWENWRITAEGMLPFLEFSAGSLVGIHAEHHADLVPWGIEDEGFYGSDFRSCGAFPFMVGEGAHVAYSAIPFDVRGSWEFSEPELDAISTSDTGSTLALLGSAVVLVGFFRRKIR